MPTIHKLWTKGGRHAALLFSVLAACADDERHAGERDIDLWPIPSVGSPFPADATLPDARVSTLRDAGLDAARDAADPGPLDLSLQVFDPEQVYIFGTLSEGACFRDAVAPLLDPNKAVVGFTCEAYAGSATIRATDGNLLYLSTNRSVYVFRCDGCTQFTATSRYPEMPEANDIVLSKPACPNQVRSGFLVARDGAVMQLCNNDWFNESGAKVASGDILAFGGEGTALTAQGVLRLADGQLTAFNPPLPRAATAHRTRADGYWLALPGVDAKAAPELWHAAFDGTTKLVGTYPALPANQQLNGSSKLDGKGRLVQLTTDTIVIFRDTIVRRSIDGESAIVYDEGTQPLVQLHGSNLFTGS